MATRRKQVAFDLDTKALVVYYPSDNWNGAYDVIKRHMQNNDFTWQQGSVYISNNPISSRDVTAMLDELVRGHPWLNVCMRDCRQTDIGKEYSQNNVFNSKAKIPTREELKNAEKPSARVNGRMKMSDYMAQIEELKKNKGPFPQQSHKQKIDHER